MNPGIPCLQNHRGRGGDQALPLFRSAEHGDEVDAAKDEAMHVNEVPHARHADGVPVARRANERREIAGIVLGRPEPVGRNLDRRQADPLAARRAVVVEVEPWMIGQDGKTAADEHGYEEEIEEVAVADPERKAMRASKVVGVHHGDGWNVRQAAYGYLNPRRGHQRRNDGGDSDQNRRTNPEAVAAIRGIMNGGVFRVKLDHCMSPLAVWNSSHSARAKTNPSLPLPAQMSLPAPEATLVTGNRQVNPAVSFA